MNPLCHIPDGGNWVKVCVTCDHEPAETARGRLLGDRLARAIQAGLRRRWFAEGLQLRPALCLGDCQYPSTVVFGATGKCKLRFHALEEADTEAILDVAEAYVRSVDGELDLSTWPQHLRKRLVTLVRPPGSERSAPGAGSVAQDLRQQD